MPEPPGGDGVTLLHRAVAATARALLSSVARVRVIGLEHVPRTGPLIVIANHASNADPPLVGGWLQPALGRPLRFMAKEQLFHSPLAPLLRDYGAIMVRAGGSDVDAYRQARAVLRDGGVLCLFPEGKRSTDGQLQEARQGVSLLAARSGVPVLPIGISGADAFLPPGASRPRIGTRITVSIGPPFRVTLDPRLDRRAATEAATAELMSHLAALLPPERRGAYTEPLPRRQPAPPGPPRIDPVSALASFSAEGHVTAE